MQGRTLRNISGLALMMLANGVGAASSDTGSWSGVIDLPLIPVAVSNLPNGEVLAWAAKYRLSFNEFNPMGRTYSAVFNPSSGRSTEVLISNTNHDMFCPGINNLPDGRILVAGGSSSEKTSIYDPSSGVWSSGGDMNTPRGYQGNVTLSDGSVLTLGGSWSGGIFDKAAERWTPQAGWVPYPAITSLATVRDGAPDPRGEFRDDNHGWLWAAPNGKVFHAGPSYNMHWIDLQGDGLVTPAGRRGDDDYAMNGTTVMYDIGKILKAGGAPAYEWVYPENFEASQSSYVIDINNDNASVERVQNMAYQRAFHNSVVLPNGEVFVSGGMKKPIAFSDLDAVFVSELWNPVSKTWRTVAPMATPRTYHSVSILLNDGRVFVGGGGLCPFNSTTCDISVNHADAEIFSPPYLFNPGTDTLATRPVITQAPGAASFNGTVSVSTNSSVSQFVLIRSNSATHSVNNEQRRVPLSFTRDSSTRYRLNIPGRNIAPPGDYMLFALNSAGTPSLAKTVRVGSSAVEQTLADGIYQFESPTSGQRLGAPSWYDFQARMVMSGDWTDQQWRVKNLGGLLYTLQNVSTGKYLEVNNAFCGDQGFETVVGSSAATQAHQRWVITKSGGNVVLRPQHCKTKALDREQNLNDADAIVWDYQLNHPPQQWKVNTVEVTGPVTPPVNPGGNNNGTVTLTNGEYWLTSPVQGQNLTLASWANYVPRMVNTGPWDDQKWQIRHVGNGIHTIQNSYHEQYLQVSGAFCGEGLGLTSSSTNAGSANQQWRVYASGSNYTLRPAHCDAMALDREQGLVDANAITWQAQNNHAPQLWQIRATGEPIEPVSPPQTGVLASGRYWLENPSDGQRMGAPTWHNLVARMLLRGPWEDQQWDITNLGGGEYTLQNPSTGKYLQVANAFCGDGSGAVNSSDTGAADHQRWFISESAGNYFLRPTHCEGKGLDREQGLVNADAIIWDFDEANLNQRWTILPVE